MPHDVFVLPSRRLPQPLWRKTNSTLTVQYKDIYKYKYKCKYRTHKDTNTETQTKTTKQICPPLVAVKV